MTPRHHGLPPGPEASRPAALAGPVVLHLDGELHPSTCGRCRGAIHLLRSARGRRSIQVDLVAVEPGPGREPIRHVERHDCDRARARAAARGAVLAALDAGELREREGGGD
jgi:hypothetical protein